MSFFDEKIVLITGGAGSFGRKFIKTLLKEHQPTTGWLSIKGLKQIIEPIGNGQV